MVEKSKGKGKMHKGLGFQPVLGEQRRSGGYCNWCWRLGHKEAQCWFKQESSKSSPPQDPLQRDTREWTTSAERKGKVTTSPKEKDKEKGKIHRKETTTKTRLELWMRKRDSAR